MTDSTGHYTVLARRFRPQTFDDVVGQERIGQALRNAIRADRVAHAYLFTGARGVGKTSTARIFAKALNCPHVKDAVPCNECDVCRSIGAGSDVDVLEIDGASNRGIDDIRSLRANVNVKSMRSPYKVYIIDEVHMLTREAFNALLKTLEEPPPRVKFVFCTTEPNRVPETILSRCQRFDFGTIATDSIRERLRQIASAEGVQVDDEALELVARRAAGSMRDSQSLFDQLLAFGGERLTTDDVHRLLGTASDERLIQLFDAIIARNRKEALELLDRSLGEGVQVGSFSDQVLHYLRDLLIVAVGADDVPLESVAAAHRGRLVEQAQKWGLRTVTAAMQVLADTKSRMQRVNHDRVLMELAVIRLSLLEELDNLGALIASLQSGSPSAAPERQPSRPGPATHGAPTASDRPPAPAAPENRAKPEVSAASPPVTESPEPKCVEFSESALTDFLTEVYTCLGDKISSHLRRASAIAISGPNDLVVSFPQSYFLSMQYVERPEVLQQIRETVSKVAGHPVEVSIVATAATPEVTSGRTNGRQGGARRRPQELNQDQFVEQAVSIFSGTVVDVREIREAQEED